MRDISADLRRQRRSFEAREASRALAGSFILHLERKDLSPRIRLRLSPPDFQRPRLLPDARLELLTPRAAAELGPQPGHDLVLIQGRDARIHFEREASPARFFLFGELIIARAAAELGRQLLFDQLEQVAEIIIHSLAGEFLEAPDTVKVQRETGLFERAAAVSLFERAVVAVLRVKQQLRRERVKCGEEQRFARSIRIGEREALLDYGVEVLVHVNLVGVGRAGAAYAELKTWLGGVAHSIACARALDHIPFRIGHGLAVNEEFYVFERLARR